MRISAQNPSFSSQAIENTGTHSAAPASTAGLVKSSDEQNPASQYPTHYPDGKVKDDFTPFQIQHGQSGTYRHYDPNGNLASLELKAPNGRVVFERTFGADGSQNAKIHNTDGSSTNVSVSNVGKPTVSVNANPSGS